MNVVLHPAVKSSSAGKLHRARRSIHLVVWDGGAMVPAATDPRLLVTNCGIKCALVERAPEGSGRRRCITCFGDSSVLPGPGERLVFGEHVQVPRDADTAPAWYPETDGVRDARFRRWVKGGKA